jgi:tetratricopeptide (TPR) repeat protein
VRLMRTKCERKSPNYMSKSRARFTSVKACSWGPHGMRVSPALSFCSHQPCLTLTSLNNLAFIFDSKGEYDRALPLYEECLVKQKRVLGDEHPDTLTSLNNVAVSFNNKGEYDRALPLLEECLAKKKRVLGDEHPNTRIVQKSRDSCARSLEASSS